MNEKWKTKTQPYAIYERHFKYKHRNGLNVNRKQKTRIAILISDKVDFETKRDTS